MPVLSLKTNATLDPTERADLARELTRIAAQTLGKQADVTAVLVESLPTAHWFVGQRASPRPTVLLEIDITAGTNSPAQKAEFIAAAWAELQLRLATGDTLEDASYVIVREISATDWGYGGRTQQARKALRTGG